jgi:acetyl/propionyl-CoA carboxylase alpha subunit
MYLEKLIEEPRHIEIKLLVIHWKSMSPLLKEIVQYKDVIKID